MINETSPNQTNVRNIDNQHSVSRIEEDEPWSKKSLQELEQDADQVLEDIRNIGSVTEASNKATRDSTQDLGSVDSATNSSNSLPMAFALKRTATFPPTLIEEKSPMALNSAGDIDDESIRGELERLDSVADAIRLSLDGKSFANMHESTSPLFSQATAGNDFLAPLSPLNKLTEKDAVRVKADVLQISEQFVVNGLTVSLKHVDMENKSAHWIMALCIAFSLIASIWIWTIYTMIIVRQCEVLNADGVVRWPTCSWNRDFHGYFLW